MGNANFRDELELARKALSTEQTAELLQQAMLCCVNIAEQNLSEQRCTWQNAALARELFDYAKKLLKNGNRVIDACYESGFGTVRNFSRRFKEKYGIAF